MMVTDTIISGHLPAGVVVAPAPDQAIEVEAPFVQIIPTAVIQESRNGNVNSTPAVLAANWGYQYIGLLFPAVDVQPTSVSLFMTLEASDTDYQINQMVSVYASPVENGTPSTWTAVEEDSVLFTQPSPPGTSVILDVPIDSAVMAEDGWAVVLHSAESGRANNLRAVPDSVRLVVGYAEPDQPEPEPREYEYTLYRDFRPGDSVALNVVDSQTEFEIASMRFVIPGGTNGV